jgi:hypothetical protein
MTSMADFAQTWAQALPTMRQAVTGVGVWAALNAVKPLAVENGFLVLGLDAEAFELAGHLRIPSTKKLIESEMGRRLGETVHLRVIEGTTLEHWERNKKRDDEQRRMQDVALQKQRAELSARTNWESVFESLSRRYAAVPNKSIPMNRARFFEEAISILAEARMNQVSHDDLAERNFARCIERVAQYSEVASTLVAHYVLKAAGEL